MQNEREFLLKTMYAIDLRKCAIYIASQSDNIKEYTFYDLDLEGYNEPDIYYTVRELVRMIEKSKIFVLPKDAQSKNIKLAKIIGGLRKENYLEHTVGGYKHYKLKTRAIEAYKSQFI